MNSPEYIPFSKFIKIDRRKTESIYIQITYQFIRAVQAELLEDGYKIPGSRILSKELKVHRKTVIAALEELQNQGWIESKPAVGTFVKNPKTKKATNTTSRFSCLEKAGFHFRKSFILDTPDQSSNCQYRFTDGQPDYGIVKAKELSRFFSAAMKRKKVVENPPGFSSFGNLHFLEQLSYYINLTRKFHISKEHLIHSAGKEALLYILTQLLVETGAIVLVGEYSRYFSNMVFQQAGAVLKTIPIDDQGIDVEYIKTHFRAGEIKCIHINPQHQYPTTICLSPNRKRALITLAEEYNFIIIEDDSNAELTFERSMDPPLFKMDKSGHVLYFGTFGAFLPPGFQSNFMIAPKDFVVEAQKYLPIFGNIDLVKEQALSEMIYEGDIHRYQRKALTIYRNRRNLFAGLLQKNLARYLSSSTPKGGLAFWCILKNKISLNRLAEYCQRSGLYLPGICMYQNKEIAALRLGFGHLDEEEMRASVNLLGKAFEEMENK